MGARREARREWRCWAAPRAAAGAPARSGSHRRWRCPPPAPRRRRPRPRKAHDPTTVTRRGPGTPVPHWRLFTGRSSDRATRPRDGYLADLEPEPTGDQTVGAEARRALGRNLGRIRLLAGRDRGAESERNRFRLEVPVAMARLARKPPTSRVPIERPAPSGSPRAQDAGREVAGNVVDVHATRAIPFPGPVQRAEQQKAHGVRRYARIDQPSPVEFVHQIPP